MTGTTSHRLSVNTPKTGEKVAWFPTPRPLHPLAVARNRQLGSPGCSRELTITFDIYDAARYPINSPSGSKQPPRLIDHSLLTIYDHIPSIKTATMSAPKHFLPSISVLSLLHTSCIDCIYPLESCTSPPFAVLLDSHH